MKHHLTFNPDQSSSERAVESGVEPHTHTVFVHSSGMMATHDMACPVCMDRPAILRMDRVAPGSIQPCRPCQDAGWHIRRRRSVWHTILDTLGIGRR